MKLLLTSAGIKNTSIHNTLIDLLGKPIAESNALCIPTAGYGNPHGNPGGPWRFISGGDETLGVVDFSIFPHLDHPALPENTMADAERWAASMSVPCYAIDDETAIKVVGGTAEVVSEGHWKRLTP